MALWERRPDESSKAYQAFVIYRDLGASRSLQKAWEQYQDSTKPVSGYFKAWSTKFDWVARAQAWDDEQQIVADETLLNVVGDNLARERDALLRAELDDYHAALDEYRRAMTNARLINREHTGFTTDPNTGETIKVITVRLTPNELIRLTRWRLEISRLGRLALNLPMSVRENRLADENGDALPLAALLDDGEDDES